ncbi:MAG: Crp/Fnr family transcriptional regulator [Negativicutes bacterium]|nr:Crp/Fnr family transcriptional regulator [Negativicutes bacterium]
MFRLQPVVNNNNDLEPIRAAIEKHQLFSGLSADDMKLLLAPPGCRINVVEKGEMFAQQGESCPGVVVVVEGQFSAHRIAVSGEAILVKKFAAGDCMGPAMLYAKNKIYPFTMTADCCSTVLTITFVQIEAVLRCSLVFNNNYIRFLSGRIDHFRRKLAVLAQKDARTRILLYLKQELESANGSGLIKLRHSKTVIAQMLGLARPSLVRELGRMSDEGLISVDGRLILVNSPAIFDGLADFEQVAE